MEPNDNRYSADLTSQAKPAVDENHDMAVQIHALAIVVKHQKSRELTATYRFRALEDSLARERLDNQRQRDYIDDLSAPLKNNNADVIFSLRKNIAELEEENETLSWTESRLRDEIRRLEELVDSSNISRLKESIEWERKSNCRLRDEIRSLASELGRLHAQIRYLQASRPVEETAGNRDNYSSDDDKSLFSNCDDDGGTYNFENHIV
jgi:hypothetical protein